MMTEKFIGPETVGQMLKAEFLEPLKLSQNALAQAIGVPSNRINGIINGTRGIAADTDLRLTRYFGLTEGFFLRYQDAVDWSKLNKKSTLNWTISFRSAVLFPSKLPKNSLKGRHVKYHCNTTFAGVRTCA